MQVNVVAGNPLRTKADAFVFFLPETEHIRNQYIPQIAEFFPESTTAYLTSDTSGKNGTVCILYAIRGNKPIRLILVGTGHVDAITRETLRRASSLAARRCNSDVKHCSLVVPSWLPLSTEESATAITEGTILGFYKFTQYKTTQSPVGTDTISIVVTQRTSAVQRAVEDAAILCEAVYLTRDLANMPGNDLYPETLAQQARQAAKKSGFQIQVFDKRKIEALRMGGLLAVSQGSYRPPVFIIMEWRGGKAKQAPIVFVGKGITFDTGGISLKPAERMGDMKMDMHGAATVIGTLYAAAKLKLPINVVGLVPAAENMPSGSAYRPGDVLRFMNGKTAEIENTDAEGRLILADALTYADRYRPQAVIDVATLTGACVIALGHVTTALMGNDRQLLERIKDAAELTNEYVCELPLHEEYLEQIKSDVADVKNSGGRPAGAITAALFLKHFIGNYPWAHLDIAGTGIAPKEGAYTPKGATGVGVRMFVELLRQWYLR